MTTESLSHALAGRYDKWWWSTGLTPEAIGADLAIDLRPGHVRHGGELYLQAASAVSGQPYAVRFRWDLDGELAKVELSQPAVDPSWEAVLAALGDPDVVFARGRGPVPGGNQRCHLDRGLTVFDSGGLGYQAVWLYPPMREDDYPERTGAFQPLRRARR